jgi:hypothetical protein
MDDTDYKVSFRFSGNQSKVTIRVQAAQPDAGCRPYPSTMTGTLRVRFVPLPESRSA